MKNFKTLLATGIVTALATFLPNASHAAQGGTSILHLLLRETMTNTGADTNASGRVEAKQNKQGRSNHQQLNIFANNLDASAPYQLLALLGDDTNFTHVADLTSDADGKIAVRYRRVDAGNGNGHGNGPKLGRGKSLLPAALNPVTDIRELAIQNSSTQAVLTADFSAPNKFEYLIKRPLTNDGFDSDAAGTLRIKGNGNHATIRIAASNLETNGSYLLLLNGSINETNTTDASGKLATTTSLITPTDILDLRTLSISDAGTNSVLSAKLP